jgi:hypothetical protein
VPGGLHRGSSLCRNVDVKRLERMLCGGIQLLVRVLSRPQNQQRNCRVRLVLHPIADQLVDCGNVINCPIRPDWPLDDRCFLPDRIFRPCPWGRLTERGRCQE